MYLYGASGHAKVIIEILENSGIIIDGLFDDNSNIKSLCGYSCSLFTSDKLIAKELIITIGDNKVREFIVNKIGLVEYGKAIDNKSIISKNSVIEAGTVVMPGAIINTGTSVGKHSIINTNVSVDHDCTIENYVHLSPGCAVAGGVQIEEGTHVGIGSCIIQNLKIGKWCTIGAGSVIIRDIPDYSVVVGNPGRIIKTIVK
jgi:acetyltransferase EpsM